MTEPVLVGDVGGTSARFAVACRDRNGVIQLSGFRKQSNNDYTSLAASLSAYLSTIEQRPRRSLIAIAGPVQKDGSVTLTNRDWDTIRPEDLVSACGFDHVRLVNDFAAMARAVAEFPNNAFQTIRSGEADPDAPILVTGPGTGFGMGLLLPLMSGGYSVLTGEGGHAAYAPRTVREAELTERLQAEYGYVSTEMIVSGAWLIPVFDTLSDMHGHPRRSLSPKDIMEAADAGDPVCVEVCSLRASAIMGAVGDGVLTMGGKGGAVLTGTVAERMVNWLRKPEAVERFCQRGSHTHYMDNIPVRVLTAPEASLIGAAALSFEGRER